MYHSIDLRATNDNLQVFSNNEFNIPLKENIDIANLWHGKTYPNRLGWNSMSTQQDSTQQLHYFVTDTLKWKAHNVHQTIVENSRYANKSSKTLKQTYASEAISPLWFFVIFICCVAYLWLEPKILG